MPLEAGIDPARLTADFSESIEQVRVGVQRIIDGFNKVVEEFMGKIWLMGGLAAYWAARKLSDARDGLQKFIDKARYLIDHSTPIVSLMLTSFDWLYRVQGPASAAAGRVNVKGDRLRVYWKGEAAEAYDGKLPFQQAAASDMAAKADFISGWLFAIAKANVEYALKMGEYVALIAGAVVQAAVDAASVFGIIEAINAVAGAAGALVEKAINDLFGIAGRAVDLLKNIRDAAASVNNMEKLPGPPPGTWPQAVDIGQARGN